MRADVFLVDFGHATTRSQAQRLIAAGVEWRLSPLAPWQKVAKNGDDIPSVAEVRLLDDAEAKYISRGGTQARRGAAGHRPGGDGAALP
jgi:23S rRNA (cytidine1920-2'-O)/16S rRNA (cytidine1409-2'-O)-methyltransferase